MSGMRDEKIPALKLTVVQYVIVAILAVLITGLWRLQILGASNWRELAEANQRVVPEKLTALGHRFRQPEITDALAHQLGHG